MNLTQLERIKTELNVGDMDKSRLKRPCCRDWKLPGTLLRKLRGTYIIMYINSRALLAKGPEWMESGESKRFKGVTGSLARHKKRI
jgi:hypothetical protein